MAKRSAIDVYLKLGGEFIILALTEVILNHETHFSLEIMITEGYQQDWEWRTLMDSTCLFNCFRE